MSNASFRQRLADAAIFGRAGDGFGMGVLAGLVVGVLDALALSARGFGSDAQLLWYGPLLYATTCGPAGAVVALLGGGWLGRGRRRALTLAALLTPLGGAVIFQRLRDGAGTSPALELQIALTLACLAVALALLLVGPRLLGDARAVWRRPLLALLVVVLLAGFSGARLAPTQAITRVTPGPVPALLAERPNLMLILASALRADQLDCASAAARARTPNLCRLASDGGSLYDGFAHSTKALPGAASLLGSLLPTTLRAPGETRARLPASSVTLAEALQRRGYTTGAFVANPKLDATTGLAQGFDAYHALEPRLLFGARKSSSALLLYQLLRRLRLALPLTARAGDHYPDAQAVNAHAAAWLERQRKGRFFLFLHYMDLREPWFARAGDTYVAQPAPSPMETAPQRRIYQQRLARFDARFAELAAQLEELGLWRSSLIALTSDHGVAFGEHGDPRRGRTLHDEWIRVPLLIKWPAEERRAPERMRAEPARLIDVAPTLLSSVGARIPPLMQGLDLARAASGPGGARSVFSETRCAGRVLRAIRTARWKWIEAPEGACGQPGEQLFDLSLDPEERDNRVEREPGTAAELARLASEQAGVP